MISALAGLKESGVATVIVAHRPSVLSVVDRILVLDDGRVTAFGAKEAVLREMASGVRVGPRKVVSMPLKSTEKA